ncbi:glycosyltransferase family 4 protein [Ramlibacter sp. MAHUQ-53]|uniref:glycosyltransferase family 4 protein n=1 Tax=unclassified Ramlibacter TaxID=2617605 RepID=UPI00362C9658
MDTPPTILVACPWSPVGGGMFKVADYLIQAQADPPPPGHARLRPLDTRGAGHAAASLGVLARAVAQVTRARHEGLAGVHVNLAERLSLVRKCLLVVACHRLGVPVVLHLHAAQLHRGWPRLPAPAQALVRRVFALPRCCVVLGHNAAAFVAGELGVPASRVEVVTNGVPEPGPAPARPRPAASGPLRLLFVGNLSDRKGVPELLQAMARPELASMAVELTLAGGGDASRYQAMARALGLGPRVRFAGWAAQDEVARLLAGADALVLPSHDEGLPLAVLEALARGVPVVCTPVGEIPLALADGREAWFVPPGDPAALARGLARVLGDAALREALRARGRALYLRAFSMPRFFAQVADVHRRHFGVAAALAVPGAGPVPGPSGARPTSGAVRREQPA